MSKKREWANELMDIEDQFEEEVREEMRKRLERRVQERLEAKERGMAEIKRLKKKDQSTCT